MSQLLYKIINPPIKLLLQSPLHSIMSHNTLVIEFTGRKSGKVMSTPISYYQTNDSIHCFTGKPRVWWRNLTTGATVRLLIQNRRINATPQVITDEAEIKLALAEFLLAVPRDASHSNVKLANDGTPNQQDIELAAKNLVLMKFTPD